MTSARAWWSGTAAELLAATPTEILGLLTAASSFPVEDKQKHAWLFEIAHLKAVANSWDGAYFFLEFAIPRMGRRADAIIVCGGLLFVVEYKVGEAEFSTSALEQAHGYALDLKNFHATSHDKKLIPVVVATAAPPQDIVLGLFATDDVAAPLRLAADDLLPAIAQMVRASGGPMFDARTWANGRYQPTPTIIEAASALYGGHDVQEISRSEAGVENLARTTVAIGTIIAKARETHRKALIFVTGVPGAGKTLAGLNIACSRLGGVDVEDATFLSGNGPLVAVLRAALAQDARLRAQEQASRTAVNKEALAQSVHKFIQNVHNFRNEYVKQASAPSEHVVVFDEAQRAWDQAQTARFMADKYGVAGFDQSEPEFLLSVMDRHTDWCVVICLVGEGQEINRGEAGIGAWVTALQDRKFASWSVHASPHLTAADSGLTAPERWLLNNRALALDESLHLAVSVRSFRAERVADWVAAVLGDDAAVARAAMRKLAQFPIYRTRSLAAARRWLRERRRATERAGLLASANAMRLKPEGLYVQARIKPVDWFLKTGADIRGSNALEDVATEFDVRGLELDWTVVAWDLNLRRTADGWETRQFRGSGWNQVRVAATQKYVVNAYRVLLTRARQGMILFIPKGDPDDPTRPPTEYDAVDRWLQNCGVSSLDG